jgi:hypothetical protein
MTYFNEVLKSFLINENTGNEIDEWICALGNLRVDLSPYLSLIKSHPTRLIEFYEVNSEALQKGKLRNGFWSDAADAENQVVVWFQSPEIRNDIDKAYGIK